MEYSFQPAVHDISKLEKKVETWQTLHEHSSLNQTAFYEAIAILGFMTASSEIGQ